MLLSVFFLAFTSWSEGLVWLLAETYDELPLLAFYLHSDIGRGLLIGITVSGTDRGGQSMMLLRIPL